MKWVWIGSMLWVVMALGCKETAPKAEEQTVKEALEEMCSIPEELHGDPTSVGPDLAQRISNPEVRDLLARLDDPKELLDVLAAHEVDAESCDLVTIMAETP